MKNKTGLTFVFTMLLLIFVCPAAYAQDASSESDSWQFHMVPYLWAAGLEGDISIGRVDASIDLDFGDILDNLDFAGQAYIEARKGKAGFFVDTTYMKLSSDAEVGPFDIDVATEMWLVDFGVIYTVNEWTVDENEGRPAALDIYGGGRHISMETEVEINLSLQILPGVSVTAETENTEETTDPIIGARLRGQLTEHLRLVFKGDIGGFDVNNIEFMWHVLAALGYDLSKNSTVWLAYRHLDIDLEKDTLEADITMTGPMLGASFRF